MKMTKTLGLAALSLALVAGGVWAADKPADKAAQRAELQKAASSALEKFYAAKPELKAAVAKAPGYGVFTTYGVSFLIGGAGGKGVVHDNKTKKVTYMDLAAASAGLQISAAETSLLIVFKTPAALTKFVDKGWTVTNTATASAGASGATVGGGEGATALEDAETYTLTKTGLAAGLAVGGSKFWKDKSLN
jgi:lipid-binding SYLF domain-containing protein